ncbi:MAG: hypothetical protein E7335_00130 [Clostridiales bacterium]|nr:hypothetical protein [Clostridiales bacterium]
MNPFEQKAAPIEDMFQDWNRIYPKSYDPFTTDPYTKCRIILMNGTEFEAQWFSHNFARHAVDNDLRRELALLRRVEQQQQRKIACLKPIGETILEHTIGYEQLAVDLTAALAKREPDAGVKKALNFALLEDFDHLYRYSDLLDMEYGTKAEHLVGGYTEIMPGRPTISEHRFPADDIRYPIDSTASLITKLNVNIITAAEQQTMNYYMNQQGFYKTPLGRKLYQEIGMIEEQHVSQYESLKDPNATWLEMLLMHEYTECYLYYSCMETETDEWIRRMWEQFFLMEISHVQHAAKLLEKYENRHWSQVIPDANFPEVLRLGENIDYVREVLGSVNVTAKKEHYYPVSEMEPQADFFRYQMSVNPDTQKVPSHAVIDEYIDMNGQDYRFMVREHPVDALRDRECDNTRVGRSREETDYAELLVKTLQKV